MSTVDTAPRPVVRDLRPGDLEAVGQMVRTSFPESLRPYLVATQAGWVNWLALVLEQPTSFATHRPAVAEEDGEILAFADYRVLGEGRGFLSYVCVTAEARGRGVARRLLGELARRYDHHEVALDVFEDNAVARGLYGSMGFVEADRRVWWRDDLPDATRPLPLTGLAASAASLATYGFCEITGESGGMPFRYGRTGHRVLRAYSQPDFDDGETTAALAATFPDLEERFVVLPAGERPQSPTAVPVLTSLRLVATDLVLTDGGSWTTS